MLRNLDQLFKLLGLHSTRNSFFQDRLTVDSPRYSTFTVPRNSVDKVAQFTCLCAQSAGTAGPIYTAEEIITKNRRMLMLYMSR